MKRNNYLAALTVFLICASAWSIAMAQAVPVERERGGGAQSAPATSSSPSAPGIGSRGTSISSTPGITMESTNATVSSIPYANRTYAPSTGSYGGSGNTGYTGGGGSVSYDRYINSGTSFRDYDSYLRSMNLFDLLVHRYRFAFGPDYFSRYYLNREPILNRQTLHYSLRESVGAVRELDLAVNQLERLLKTHDSSVQRAAADPAWAPAVNRIRSLAQKIRKDELLDTLEIRKNQTADSRLKNLNHMDAADQAQLLIGMARQLRDQIENLYQESSPAVVSVNSLSRPTFDSLAKGIETVARRIEKGGRS